MPPVKKVKKMSVKMTAREPRQWCVSIFASAHFFRALAAMDGLGAAISCSGVAADA